MINFYTTFRPFCIIIFSFLLCIEGRAQEEVNIDDTNSWNKIQTDSNCLKSEIPVALFTLDMCLPCSNAMMSNRKNRNRLIMRHNELAAFRIVNNNPLRYTISLSGKEIDLFSDNDFTLNPMNIGPKKEEGEDDVESEKRQQEFEAVTLNELKKVDPKLKENLDKLQDDSISTTTLNEFSLETKSKLVLGYRQTVTKPEIQIKTSDYSSKVLLDSELKEKLRTSLRIQAELHFLEQPMAIQTIVDLDTSIQRQVDNLQLSLIDSVMDSYTSKDDQKINNKVHETTKEYYSIKKSLEEISAIASMTDSVIWLAIEVSNYFNELQHQNCLSDKNRLFQKVEKFILMYQRIAGSLGDSKSMINNLNRRFNETSLQIKKTGNKELARSINNALENLKTKIYDKDFEAKLKSIEEKLGKLNAIVTNSYTLPYQMTAKNKDLLEIEISRKDNLSKQKENYKYEIWIRNGFKIDLSAGVFLSTLKNHEYATKESESDTTLRVIFKQDQGDFTFAFGTLLHATWRMNELFNPGVSVGFAFTNETEYQLLTGITTFIGKRSRIGLNIGASWGFVKRLDGAYEAGNNTSFSGSTPPTIDTFCQGLYFGFTYNLFAPNSEVKK